MDFYFQFPFEKKDTTVFRLSPGCSPDVLPEQKELKSPHSYYASRTWYNESEKSIYTTTTLILKKHKIPATDFAEVRNFFEEVIADDSQRIVIKKSATNSPEVKKAF